MELIEGFKIALQSLWANKLRSILTLMGVVIGVAVGHHGRSRWSTARSKFVATKVYGYGADVLPPPRPQPSVIFVDGIQQIPKAQRLKDR